MATVNGTPGDDFIHMAGDGKAVPANYNEVTGITTGPGSSYIALGDGLDYLYFVGLTKAQLLASDFVT